MPTYDYVCDACDHKFELFQSIKEDAKKKCPECGKQKLRRLFGTGGAIMFKGSGFYTTDYRSESYKKSASADKPAESKPEGKSSESKSSETKSSEGKSSESKPSGSDSSSSSSKRESKGDHRRDSKKH